MSAEETLEIAGAGLERLSGAALLGELFQYSVDEQRSLLEALSPEDAAHILEEVPVSHGATLLEGLDVALAAAITAELDSDVGADILGDLDEAFAETILQRMDESDAADVRTLIAYPEFSAGGLMVLDDRVRRGREQVVKVLDSITQSVREGALLVNTYRVKDRYGRFLGEVKLRDLVLADSNARLRDIARPSPCVDVLTSLDVLHQCFEHTEANTLSVVEGDVLRGVLNRADVEWALRERDAASQMRAGGIVGGEELRTMPLTLRSKRRLSWLTLNIGLNILAASIIAMFEETLVAVIALAVFLPIVSDMSGCSGNQAVAVSMRELTLGIVGTRDVLRVWWQEARLGVLNGVVLGILLGIAAYLWKGSAVLGLVVGSALALNTLVSVSIGGTVPVLLKRFGVDPAVASGPILTTVTDMCGFFLVLGLATLMLDYL